MATPYKLSDWNELIQKVNDAISNPPSGCPTVPQLPPVTAPHRWSVADITSVRDTLMATCPTISFQEPLVLWSQAVIDEITNALGRVWCQCNNNNNNGGAKTPLQICLSIPGNHLVPQYQWTGALVESNCGSGPIFVPQVLPTGYHGCVDSQVIAIYVPAGYDPQSYGVPVPATGPDGQETFCSGLQLSADDACIYGIQ